MSPDGASPARRRPTSADLVDLLAYVVVLNLAIEYLPSVLSETFTLSLLTAAVLKVVLEIVVLLKERLKRRFARAASLPARILAGALLWLTLVGSKFVVLEVIALLFAGRVHLGGFFSVTALIIALLATRSGVRALLGLRSGL